MQILGKILTSFSTSILTHINPDGSLVYILSVLVTRKYNEKQAQNKMKLRQAKQVFLKTTAQKDSTIQRLENDLALANSLSFKVTL